MAEFASIIGQFTPKPDAYEKYRGVPHVDEAAFHTFFEENPNASAVIQGYVEIIHRELTGEPFLMYGVMHLVCDAQKLKMFLYAFGEDPATFPDDVNELWKRAVALFGKSRHVKPAPNKSLAVKDPTMKDAPAVEAE